MNKAANNIRLAVIPRHHGLSHVILSKPQGEARAVGAVVTSLVAVYRGSSLYFPGPYL